MTRAAATRAELHTALLAARAELHEACAKCDPDGKILALTRCDALLDRWALIPRQR